ncbi:hypothetical protein BTUL_0151g00340 [Botrytis tulipae]|uniref:CCHC-type domain-containing protein n=1 Tax=Botrytis tulipae TaxID=87230 RepID=A0A4Z1EGL2_9HELO|nr:hypothetical protein BTUL_0151g00340 [Botrytis tulipae]
MSDHSYMEGLEAMGHKAHSDGMEYSAIYSWYDQTMDRLQSDGSNMSEEFRSLTAKVETWKHFWPDELFFAGISLKDTPRQSFGSKDQNQIEKPVKNPTYSSSEQHSSQENLTTLSPTAGPSTQPIIPDPSRSPIESQQGSHGNRTRDHKKNLNEICANCNMRGHILSYCVAPVDEFGFISGCPTYEFSLKQAGKFKISYDDFGKPKGLYPDPAWKTPDKVLSQAYPRTMDVILPRLWHFHSRLNRKSADLGHKFEVFLKSMSETASDNEIIICEIVRLAEALEDILEFELKEARGESLATQMSSDITTKRAKELEFEAKLNAYHVPENYRPRNHDLSPDNERTVLSTEEKGKGKAIDVHSPSLSRRYAAEEQSMYQKYGQRYAPNNPFNEGTSSNAPSENTRRSENLVARKKFGSNLTPAVENYKRRDLTSPEKVPDFVPVDTHTQSYGHSEQGENQLSKFAEFKYEQSKEQKQLERRISNLRRDLKEINSFEKRVEMLTTKQRNQLKMKELKERELGVLLEIRSRYVMCPEPTAGSNINTSEKRQSFGASVKQAPNLKYPEDRHNSSSGGSSDSSDKFSTSKELPPEGFQVKNLESKNIGRSPAISASSVPRHLQRFPFTTIRKSPLSYVQTAPSVGVQDSNGNNDSTSPEKSPSSLVVEQDPYPALNRRQKTKNVSNRRLYQSSNDTRTVAPAAKKMTIVPRPQSLKPPKPVTESQDTLPALNETKIESLASGHSKPPTSPTQVAASSSENISKETTIYESKELNQLQLSDEVKNQTGLISGPIEPRNLPTSITNSQNLASASSENQADHVANTNMELASRDAQKISKVDDIHQDIIKLKENYPQQSSRPYIPPFKARQMLASKEKSPSTLPQANSKAPTPTYKPPHKIEEQSPPDNEHQSSLLEEDTANHGKSPAPVQIPPQMRITQPTSKDESPLPMTQSPIQIIDPEQPSPMNASFSQNQKLLEPQSAYAKRSNNRSSSTPPDQSYLEADEDDFIPIPQYQKSPRSSNLQQKSPRTMKRSVKQRALSPDPYLPEPESFFMTPRLKETVSDPSNSWLELLDPDFFADFLDCEWPNHRLDLPIPLPVPDFFSLDDELCDSKEPIRSPISLQDPDVFLLDEEDDSFEESLRSLIPLQDPDIFLLEEEDDNSKDPPRSPISLQDPDIFLLDDENYDTKESPRSPIPLQDPDVFSLDEEDCNTKETPRPSIPTIPHSRPHRQSNHTSRKTSSGTSKTQEVDRAASEDVSKNVCYTCDKVGHYIIDCPMSWRLDQSVLDNFPYSSSRYRASLDNCMQGEVNDSNLNPGTNDLTQTCSGNSYPVDTSLPGNCPRPDLPDIANAGAQLRAKPKSDLDPPTDCFYPNQLRKGDYVCKWLPENWIETSEKVSSFFPADWAQEVSKRMETGFWEDQKTMRNAGFNFSIGNYLVDEGSGEEESEDEEIPVIVSRQAKSHDCSSLRETKKENKKKPPVLTNVTADQTGHDYNMEERVRNMLTRKSPRNPHASRIMNSTGSLYPVPGEWLCLSGECRESNTPSSIICKKCSRPRATRGVDGRIEMFQPGDWICPFRDCARHNYAKHVICKGCGNRSKAPTAISFLWKCSSFNCGETNDNGVVRCRKCGSPRILFHNPPPRATVNAFHAGDWYCGAWGCAAHNSSRDISCWKCGGTDTTLVAPGQVVQHIPARGYLAPPGWNSQSSNPIRSPPPSDPSLQATPPSKQNQTKQNQTKQNQTKPNPPPSLTQNSKFKTQTSDLRPQTSESNIQDSGYRIHKNSETLLTSSLTSSLTLNTEQSRNKVGTEELKKSRINFLYLLDLEKHSVAQRSVSIGVALSWYIQRSVA